MHLSLIKIQKYFPKFNIEPVTAADFWRVVEQENIEVREVPLLVDGSYTRKNGHDLILINSQLSGYDWLKVALHELHHYLFDIPNDRQRFAFYRNGQFIDRREVKADAFALIGILPWPELLKITSADIEASPRLAELVRARIIVRTEFGE